MRKHFDHETGEQAINMHEPTERTLRARTRGRTNFVIARFTGHHADLVLKETSLSLHNTRHGVAPCVQRHQARCLRGWDVHSDHVGHRAGLF